MNSLFYFADEVERYFNFTFTLEQLLEDAIKGRVSLAIDLQSIGIPQYTNLDNEIINLEDFSFTEFYRFVYIPSNALENNKQEIINKGVIPLHTVRGFHQTPVGHPNHNTPKDIFEAKFEGSHYEKYWHESHRNKTTAIYLTRDAISNSSIVSLLNSQTSTNADNGKKITTIPTPTEKEEKYFQKLSIKNKDRVSLIAKVIIKLENPIKKEIHAECHRIDDTLFTANFKTFAAHVWVDANKSGRTIKNFRVYT